MLTEAGFLSQEGVKGRMKRWQSLRQLDVRREELVDDRHRSRGHSVRDDSHDSDSGSDSRSDSEGSEGSEDSRSHYSDEAGTGNNSFYTYRQPLYERQAVSRHPDDNSTPLVERHDLSSEEVVATQNHLDDSFEQAWLQAHMRFDEGIETELAVINAAEGFTVEGGEGKSSVTLYCQKDALDGTAPKQGQLYWLHVQHKKDVSSVIMSLVWSCHVNKRYKSLATSLLGSDSEQEAKPSQATSRSLPTKIVARADNEPSDWFWERESVSLVSTPYFHFREMKSKHATGSTLQPLFSSQYGNAVGSYRDKLQVLPETQKWLGNERIHVGWMKSLLIGPDVLLTWSELPRSAICKDNIRFDHSNSQPLITLRITGMGRVECCSNANQDMSFAQLNARIRSLLRIQEFVELEIFEVKETGLRVTPALWAEVLMESSASLTDIRLRVQPKLPNRESSQNHFHEQNLLPCPRSASRSESRQPSYYVPRGAPNSRSVSSLNSRTGAVQIYQHPSTHSSDGRSSDRRPPSGRSGSRDRALVRRDSTPNSRFMSSRYGRLPTLEAVREDSTFKLEHTETPIENAAGERDTQPQSDGAKSWSATTLKSLEGQTIPFLIWRVTKDDRDNITGEGNFSAMNRLLKRVEDNLNNNARYGSLHKSGYQCSMSELCKRHTALLQPTQHSETADIAADNGQNDDAMPAEASRVAEERAHELDAQGENTTTSDEQRGTLYVNMIEKVNELIKHIFCCSQAILGLFVPLEEPGLQEEKTGVLGRYWGALDVLFRTFRFSALMHAAEGEQTWRIKGSCRQNNKSTAQGTCRACEEKTEYSLFDALQHLHAGDLCPETHLAPQSAHEDPCIVWLEHTKIPEKNAHFTELASELRKFWNDLYENWTLYRDLHLFIARPKVPQKGEPGEGAEESRHSSNQDSSSTKNRPVKTPALPVSLLQAFEHMVTLLTLEARALVLLFRESESTKPINNGAAFRVRSEYEGVLHQVTLCIAQSRDYLVRSIIEEENSAVRLGAVGPEYIAVMVTSNVQAGIYCHTKESYDWRQKVSSSGIGIFLGTRERVQTLSSDIRNNQRSSDASDTANRGTRSQKASPELIAPKDLIALYREHARALDFIASVDPQRRAFLAIRAFEEELKVIKCVGLRQFHCLDNMLQIMDPWTFRSFLGERLTRFGLEQTVGERCKRDRIQEGEEIEAMQKLMADLRQRVVEGIEVLDEGHRKAIRVFTLVTLFFLPLSFVTSFFGMNTVDVRDMTHSSWLYWTVAMPMTVFTFGLAYLYGYKSEAITRLITRKSWLEQGMAQSSGDVDDRGLESTESAFAKLRRRYHGRRRNTLDSQWGIEA